MTTIELRKSYTMTPTFFGIFSELPSGDTRTVARVALRATGQGAYGATGKRQPAKKRRSQ